MSAKAIAGFGLGALIVLGVSMSPSKASAATPGDDPWDAGIPENVKADVKRLLALETNPGTLLDYAVWLRNNGYPKAAALLEKAAARLKAGAPPLGASVPDLGPMPEQLRAQLQAQWLGSNAADLAKQSTALRYAGFNTAASAFDKRARSLDAAVFFPVMPPQWDAASESTINLWRDYLEKEMSPLNLAGYSQQLKTTGYPKGANTFAARSLILNAAINGGAQTPQMQQPPAQQQPPATVPASWVPPTPPAANLPPLPTEIPPLPQAFPPIPPLPQGFPPIPGFPPQAQPPQQQPPAQQPPPAGPVAPSAYGLPAGYWISPARQVAYVMQAGDYGTKIVSKLGIAPKGQEGPYVLQLVKVNPQIKDWTKVLPGTDVAIPADWRPLKAGEGPTTRPGPPSPGAVPSPPAVAVPASPPAGLPPGFPPLPGTPAPPPGFPAVPGTPPPPGTPYYPGQPWIGPGQPAAPPAPLPPSAYGLPSGYWINQAGQIAYVIQPGDYNQKIIAKLGIAPKGQEWPFVAQLVKLNPQIKDWTKAVAGTDLAIPPEWRPLKPGETTTTRPGPPSPGVFAEPKPPAVKKPAASA